MSDVSKKKRTAKEYLSIFLSFFKIGAFTFGGGYAMIPLIQGEVVEKKHWVTEDDILEIVAIAESTPGPIAINAATFVGYRFGGVFGSFCATMGTVLPSFFIILLISGILRQFQDNVYVQYAFFGIRAGVLALILSGLIKMYKKCPKGAVSYIVFGLSFALAVFLDLNIFIIIIICALFGLITSLITAGRAKKC